MPRFQRFLFVVIALIFARGEFANAADEMAFKNNLLPGYLSIHKISRTTTRTVPRRQYKEKLVYSQVADWVQCNIDEPNPGRVNVYQMMVDHPADVVGLFRGAESIKPLPSPSTFNLSIGSTRLHNAVKLPRDAPFQVPITDPAEQVVLRTLLDFAHWPKAKVAAGHRWQRDITDGGFRGKQTYEFVDLGRIENDVVGRVTLYIQGRFDSPLDRDYQFEKGQAILYWSRPDRVLMKMEAQATYKRLRPSGDEQYKLKLDVNLVRQQTYTGEQQSVLKDQLILFAKALQQQREGSLGEAAALCAEYHRQWPDSLWTPAVDELSNRVQKNRRPTEGISSADFDKALAGAIVAWEAATANDDYDLMERTRQMLTQLTREEGARLRRMAKSDEAVIQAQAVFALAFSPDVGALNVVQSAVKAKSAKVRAMALTGLAARQDPSTNVELLVSLLDDSKSSVRLRACRAIAVCVPREHFSIAKATEKLAALMIRDQSTGVRREAIRALAAIGATTDVPKLEKALTHELDQSNRREIERAIRMLKKQNG